MIVSAIRTLPSDAFLCAPTSISVDDAEGGSLRRTSGPNAVERPVRPGNDEAGRLGVRQRRSRTCMRERRPICAPPERASALSVLGSFGPSRSLIHTPRRLDAVVRSHLPPIRIRCTPGERSRWRTSGPTCSASGFSQVNRRFARIPRLAVAFSLTSRVDRSSCHVEGDRGRVPLARETGGDFVDRGSRLRGECGRELLGGETSPRPAATPRRGRRVRALGRCLWPRVRGASRDRPKPRTCVMTRALTCAKRTSSSSPMRTRASTASSTTWRG